MTDLEIDRALALAIGWREDQILVASGRVLVLWDDYWRRFNHRRPAVIWPIAERFNAFPAKEMDRWYVWLNHLDADAVWSDNPCTAVALAAIRSKT